MIRPRLPTTRAVSRKFATLSQIATVPTRQVRLGDGRPERECAMNGPQPAANSITNRKPNRFFFQSPFRSWDFMINTILLAGICLIMAAVLWRFWEKLSSHTSAGWLLLLTLLAPNVVYPYWTAIIRHRKINKLHLEGDISEQPAGSPIDELLSVADSSLNEGLRNTMVCFGLFLFALVSWHLLP